MEQRKWVMVSALGREGNIFGGIERKVCMESAYLSVAIERGLKEAIRIRCL